MNAFQKCVNTSDTVPLYLPQQLFLKPIARINITVQLTVKMLGKTIRHHEVMEKLRNLILPDVFSLLRVTKTTLEIIKFEAEVELKNMVNRVLSKLDNRTIKLSDFTELMRVRAAEAKLDFPTRHDWDSYFRDAKDMNEMKPGERPDTVHIGNLPTKWFVPTSVQNDEDLLPSEKIFCYTFKKFGSIRNTDIPICDPYRSKMKQHITGVQLSSFEDTDFFEGYIQFKDYIGFSECMDALRGMKLVRKEKDEVFSVNIIVNFDKSKHLSEGAIKRRGILRDRLLIKQRTKEEKLRQAEEAKKQAEMAARQKELDKQNAKESRRREREQKRKAKIMAQLKSKETDGITEKIAKEERKLLKVQRRLEAIRLVEELFKQIQAKQKNSTSLYDDKLEKSKTLTEFKELKNKWKIKDTIEQRVILKSVIADQAEDSSSSNSLGSVEDVGKNTRITDQNNYKNLENPHPANYLMDYNNVPPQYYNRGSYTSYPQRSRGYSRPRRPYNPHGRGRGMLNPFIQYAQRVLAYQLQQNAHLDYPRSPRRSRSRSRSCSHSRRRSRSRSRSRYDRRDRSRSRRSRSRSRSKSSRSRSRDSRRSRSRRSRSKESRAWSEESRRPRQRSWSQRSPELHSPPKRKKSISKSPLAKEFKSHKSP